MRDGRPAGTKALAALALCATAAACSGASAAGVDVATQQLTTSSQGGATPSPSPTPGVGPQLASLEMLDVDADGRVDRLTATFDRPLAPSTSHAGWALSNAPSGATKASLSTSGSVATLELHEGSGSLDTAVRSFTVALGNDSAISDTSGNKATFGPRPPSDGARPRFVGVATAGDGYIAAGDTITLNFSEPLAPPTTSPFTVDLLDTSPNAGNGADDVDALGIGNVTPPTSDAANRTLLGTGVFVKRKGTIFFAGSTLSVIGDSVRISIGGTCGSSGHGDCVTRGTATAGTSFTFRVLPGLSDPAGNRIVNTSVTATHPIF